MQDRKRHGARELGYVAHALGLSSTAFTLLRDLIAQRLGHYFGDDKQDMLADKLSELVAAHGFDSLLDYYYLLKYDADAERHWIQLADRLAVPETYFWRQSEQIEALVQVLVPRHARERPDTPLRIWSAACCSGEEPLSIAMALAEHGWLDRLEVEIVGSDASPLMLDRARSGLYGERSFRQLPPRLREKYFRADGNRWRIDGRIHDVVQWQRANLVDETQVAPLARADVIYCRNVFIYFSEDTVRRVIRTFTDQMPADGTLFLGASESLLRLDTELELAEIGAAYAYVKRNGAVRAPQSENGHAREHRHALAPQ